MLPRAASAGHQGHRRLRDQRVGEQPGTAGSCCPLAAGNGQSRSRV